MRFLAALASGLLLSASDHPLRWWWLQLFALVPLWWALASARRARGATWLLGTLLGIGYVAPLLFAAGLAQPILAAAGANVLQWTILAPIAARMLDRGPVLGALAAAAAVTGIELAIWYCVPLLGTAQCFARPLTAAPWLVGFVAYTGVAGLVFVLAATQALLANALRGPARSAPLAFALALVAAVAACDYVRWTRPLGTPLQVAALGWHDEPLLAGKTFDSLVAQAKGLGTRLLVTPETGTSIWAENRASMLAWLGGLAKTHALALVVGAWHPESDDNRILMFAPDGVLRGEYRKTHLVPWLENYQAGDGTPVTTQLDDVLLGGMICQDDNFTDVARGYGRLGTTLVAVPTNDWPDIREFHLENSLFRAIENGYAVVRAASSGISALVSPRGEVLQRFDHVERGGGTITDSVPTGDGTVTLYARLGDWPMAVLCAVLLVIAGVRRGRPEP